MNSLPKVTVLMSVYNGMPYLTEAVDSVVGQTLKDWILLIIDDGSTDGTAAYLDSLTDPRIQVVHQENRGLAGALNHGVDLCQTEYLARLDADDVALPTRFEKQLAFLEARPEVGLVGTQFTWLYKGRAGGGGPFPLEHKTIYSRLMNGRAGCCHSAMMCRTQVLRDAGAYWNVGLSEDWDMFLRMGEQAELANIDEVLLQVRMCDTSLQSKHMANVRSRIAYSCELARRRSEKLPSIDYEEFCAISKKQHSPWKRLVESLEIYAHSQYRKAQGEILGDRKVLGYARVGWAALCAPKMTCDRILRVTRNKLFGPRDFGAAQKGTSGRMIVHVVPASQLSADQLSAWSELRSADASLDSPFFHPGFTQAVARVRDDVEVAILEEHSELLGFFPFQRQEGNVGAPVGGRLSDFHGVVLKSGVKIDPWRMARRCRLTAWHFHHLLASQEEFSSAFYAQAGSPYLDLRGGFDAYVATRTNGSRMLSEFRQRQRRLERDFGPLRVELHTTDPAVLAQLIEWKSQQYHNSRVIDVFSFPWTVELLKLLLSETIDYPFGGQLAALYIGDKLAAVHYALRDGHVLHSWFPAYNVDFAKFSPGTHLLVELARAAPAQGITRIDLGKGPEAYKRSFMSDETIVAEGSLDLQISRRTVRRFWFHTKAWAKESPIQRPAQSCWRWIKQMRKEAQLS